MKAKNMVACGSSLDASGTGKVAGDRATNCSRTHRPAKQQSQVRRFEVETLMALSQKGIDLSYSCSWRHGQN
jgi:hypothetical protein